MPVIAHVHVPASASGFGGGGTHHGCPLPPWCPIPLNDVVIVEVVAPNSWAMGATGFTTSLSGAMIGCAPRSAKDCPPRPPAVALSVAFAWLTKIKAINITDVSSIVTSFMACPFHCGTNKPIQLRQ